MKVKIINNTWLKTCYEDMRISWGHIYAEYSSAHRFWLLSLDIRQVVFKSHYFKRNGWFRIYLCNTPVLAPGDLHLIFRLVISHPFKKFIQKFCQGQFQTSLILSYPVDRVDLLCGLFLAISPVFCDSTKIIGMVQCLCSQFF